MFVAAGEDDGYLMVYVTKPDGTSYMHVYDAATMDATPVAEVRAGRISTAAVAVLGCSRHGHFRSACTARLVSGWCREEVQHTKTALSLASTTALTWGESSNCSR